MSDDRGTILIPEPGRALYEAAQREEILFYVSPLWTWEEIAPERRAAFARLEAALLRRDAELVEHYSRHYTGTTGRAIAQAADLLRSQARSIEDPDRLEVAAA